MMSARPGINVSVKHKANGGVSPNAYIPFITAEVRCFWPPLATEAEVEAALGEAFESAITEALHLHRNGRR